MIDYSDQRSISIEQFIDLLQRSGLAARRPVTEPDRIAAMLANATLLCTAWHDTLLVGIARSVTDFAYCCYLSDLAVDIEHQRKGIGRRLIALTRSRLHPGCKLVLLAAPAAESYYSGVGFTQHPSAWFLTAG